MMGTSDVANERSIYLYLQGKSEIPHNIVLTLYLKEKDLLTSLRYLEVTLVNHMMLF